MILSSIRVPTLASGAVHSSVKSFPGFFLLKCGLGVCSGTLCFGRLVLRYSSTSEDFLLQSMSCLIFVIFVIDSVDLIEGVGLYIRSLTRAAALLATKFLVLKKSLK
ncbi:hypothetical protein, partial [Rhizobium daejeonense]